MLSQVRVLIDGIYGTHVKTDSETYRVPVEVEDGEAVGRSSDGNRFKIEIDALTLGESATPPVAEN